MARGSNTKEIKNKHSSRPVGGAETGWRALTWLWRDPDRQSVRRMAQAVPALADPAAPHSHTDKLRGPDSEWRRAGQAEQWVAPRDPTFAHRWTRTRRTAGSEADHAAQGSSSGRLSLKLLIENAHGGGGRPWGRLPASQERSWRDPQGPRVCTSPPTQEPAPEGPSWIVGIGVEDWNPEESEVGTTAPSRPLPHVQGHSAATSITQPREHLRLRPLK